MRNIREALLTGSPPVTSPKVWDITPSVETFAPEISFVQLDGLYTTSGGTFLTDQPPTPPGTPDPALRIGVARTNITLNQLTNNKTFKFGFNMTLFPGPSIQFAAMVFAPENMTTGQVRDLVTTVLFQGDDYGADFITVAGAAFQGEYNGLANMHLSTVNTVYSDNNFATRELEIFEPNTATYALVSKDTLGQVHLAIVASKPSQTDMNTEEPTVGAVTSIPENFTLHYVILSYNNGSGHGYTTIEPSLTLGASSLNIQGTSYEVYDGVQQVFDSHFPTPFTRPSATNYTPAPFPAGLVTGSSYLTYLVPEYNGPEIVRGGTALTTDNYILFTNVSPGSEVIQVLARKNELTPLAQAVESALGQLAALGPVALSEEVVYVRWTNPNETVTDTMLPVDQQRVYGSFDAAYNYLITLPKTLPKRIVFDDRDYATTTRQVTPASEGMVYELLRNNITLSTWLSYSSGSCDRAHVNNTTLELHITVDGFSFDCCRAIVTDSWAYTAANAPYSLTIGNIFVEVDSGRNLGVSDLLRIRNNNRLLFTSSALQIVPGTVTELVVGNNNDITFNTSVTNDGKLVFRTGTGNSWTFDLLPNTQPTVQFEVLALSTEAIFIAPGYEPNVLITPMGRVPPFTYDNVIMVRKKEDLGEIQGGNIVPRVTAGGQTVTYFIVGEIDLGNLRILTTNLFTHCTYRFIGFPGHSRIVGNFDVYMAGWYSNLYVDGVDFWSKSDSSAAVAHFGTRLDLRRTDIRGGFGMNIAYAESVVGREVSIAGRHVPGQDTPDPLAATMTWMVNCPLDFSDLKIRANPTQPLFQISNNPGCSLLIEGLKVILYNDALSGHPIGLIRINGVYDRFASQYLPNSLIVKDVVIDYFIESPASYRQPIPVFVAHNGSEEYPVDITRDPAMIVDKEIAFLFFETIGVLNYFGAAIGQEYNNFFHANDDQHRIGYDGSSISNNTLGITAWKVKIEGDLKAQHANDVIRFRLKNGLQQLVDFTVNLGAVGQAIRVCWERVVFIPQNYAITVTTANETSTSNVDCDLRVSFLPA